MFGQHAFKAGGFPFPPFELRDVKTDDMTFDEVNTLLSATGKGTVANVDPTLVIKDDRKKPFVTMQLEDFLDFVNEWWERSQD